MGTSKKKKEKNTLARETTGRGRTKARKGRFLALVFPPFFILLALFFRSSPITESLEQIIFWLLMNFCSSLCMFQEFENKIKQWCKEAGEDVTYEFLSVGHCNHYNIKQLNFGEKELVLDSGLLRTCSGHGGSSQRLFPLPCPSFSFYCFISVTVACCSPFHMGTHGWVARIRQLWERSTSTCRS